jgi:hypothetical protein
VLSVLLLLIVLLEFFWVISPPLFAAFWPAETEVVLVVVLPESLTRMLFSPPLFAAGANAPLVV